MLPKHKSLTFGDQKSCRRDRRDSLKNGIAQKRRVQLTHYWHWCQRYICIWPKRHQQKLYILYWFLYSAHYWVQWVAVGATCSIRSFGIMPCCVRCRRLVRCGKEYGGRNNKNRILSCDKECGRKRISQSHHRLMVRLHAAQRILSNFAQ